MNQGHPTKRDKIYQRLKPKFDSLQLTQAQVESLTSDKISDYCIRVIQQKYKVSLPSEGRCIDCLLHVAFENHNRDMCDDAVEQVLIDKGLRRRL